VGRLVTGLVSKFTQHIVISGKWLSADIFFFFLDEVDEGTNTSIPKFFDPLAVLCLVGRTWVSSREKSAFDNPVASDRRRGDRRSGKLMWRWLRDFDLCVAVHQTLQSRLDHATSRQAIEPIPGNPAFAPTGTGKLPAHGAGGLDMLTRRDGGYTLQFISSAMICSAPLSTVLADV